VFIQHAFQRTPAQYFPYTHPNWIGFSAQLVAFGGAYSVDLFFLISAFLITQLLLREQEATGGVRVGRFYIRRILRIWPLHFTYIAVLAIAGLISLHLRTPANWLVLFAMLSGNLAYALWGWSPQFLTWQLWSIAIEEQFYLGWPLILRSCTRRGLVRAALAMLAITFLARTVCWFAGAPSSLIWTNTLTRLDPLATGILIGVLMMDKRLHAPGAARVALVVAGLATILTVQAWCDHLKTPATALMLFIGYPAASLGCAMIFFGALGARMNPQSMRNRIATYLGKISYGLYIWHLLALELAIWMLKRPIPLVGDWIESSIFISLCGFALTIAMAMASYHSLELPFLRLKSRFALIPSRPA